MIHIAIHNTPLSLEACYTLAEDPSSGGVAAFIGTVRNQTKDKPVVRLEFEAYESMALSEMTKIATLIETKWNAKQIVMHHRIGTLAISDIAVIIVISTPHRKAAFEACQFAIDTLKETVPIWKKEVFEDGEIWVSAYP